MTLYVPECASWTTRSENDSEVTLPRVAPGELLLFDRPAALAVYVATDDPDEPVGLRAHPRWAELTERPEVDFTPFEDDEFDLSVVPRLLAHPDPDDVARAGELVAFAWELALHLRAEDVRELLESEEFEQVQTDPQALLGWRSRSRLAALRSVLQERWDDVVARMAMAFSPAIEARGQSMAPPVTCRRGTHRGVPLEEVALSRPRDRVGARTGFTLARPQPTRTDAVPLFAATRRHPGGTLEGLAGFVRADPRVACPAPGGTRCRPATTVPHAVRHSAPISKPYQLIVTSGPESVAMRDRAVLARRCALLAPGRRTARWGPDGPIRHRSTSERAARNRSATPSARSSGGVVRLLRGLGTVRLVRLTAVGRCSASPDAAGPYVAAHAGTPPHAT